MTSLASVFPNKILQFHWFLVFEYPYILIGRMTKHLDLIKESEFARFIEKVFVNSGLSQLNEALVSTWVALMELIKGSQFTNFIVKVLIN